MALHLVTGAIVTKRGSRHITATHYLKSHRKAIDYSLNNAELHAAAASELVEKLAGEYMARNASRAGREWINAPFCGEWIAGDMPDGKGYAFTYAGDTNRTSGFEARGFVQNCETNGKPKP